jgi:hypothetical protein
MIFFLATYKIVAFPEPVDLWQSVQWQLWADISFSVLKV